MTVATTVLEFGYSVCASVAFLLQSKDVHVRFVCPFVSSLSDW